MPESLVASAMGLGQSSDFSRIYALPTFVVERSVYQCAVGMGVRLADQPLLPLGLRGQFRCGLLAHECAGICSNAQRWAQNL